MEALQRILPYQEVKGQLDAEKKNFIKNFYNIATLITRIYNEKLYEYWGFGSFRDFVLENLDIQISVAYKMVTMINNKVLLGVEEARMLEIKPTKLLEIMSLKDPEEIKVLLLEAKTASTNDIKEKVRRAKGLDSTIWFKFSYRDVDTVQIIKSGLEKAKQECGDTINIQTGEVDTISDSRALELIIADYLSK